MKKKIQIGPFKLKISYKSNRWLDLFFKEDIKKELIEEPKSKFTNTELKLYRIFKEEYCQFFPGEYYASNKRNPSSLIYYINKNRQKEINISTLEFNKDTFKIYRVDKDPHTKDKYLIGELMYGEDKIDFFKRKNILIKETLENYSIVQDDFVLAVYDKEWIKLQGLYR